VGEASRVVILLESGERVAFRRVVTIFGVGLLGSAIARSVRLRSDVREVPFPFHWSDREKQASDLETIELAVAERLDEYTSLSVVWSAGRAGFSSTSREVDDELRSFRSLLRLTERLSSRIAPGRAHFVLLSSAGGLFEGQRQVDANSNPMPRRPYGTLKWEQEQILGAAASGLRKLILRISSVYGHIQSGHRSGLIQTLVANGIRRKVTTIVGTMTTLRDFVWVDDVANFAASRILDETPRPTPSTELLASGRPSSVFEIRNIVESRLRSPVFVSYVPGGSNSDDITFSRAALPNGWFPSDLRTNVRRISQAALGLPQSYR
jgi:nucleoside-diphosphate-sugar epimerase